MGTHTLELLSTNNDNAFTFNGVINKIGYKSIDDVNKSISTINITKIDKNKNNAGNVNNADIINTRIKTKQYGSMPKQCLVSAVIAFDNKMFPELSRLSKQVLSQLALLLDTDNPRKPVRILRQTLADATNFKVASIYRALAELEKNEIIVRLDQNRKRSGRMGAGILKLTLKAIRRLLPNWSASKATSIVEAKPRLSEKGDGKALPTPQSYSKNQSDVVDKAKYIEIENGRRIHSELFFLTKKLTSPQIFKLCRLAKDNGKLLTDIVAVKMQDIAAIAGRELYAFFTYMIGLKDDFSVHAKQIKSIEAAVKTEAAMKAEFSDWQQKLFRRKFKSTTKNTSFEVVGNPTFPFVDAFESGVRKGSSPMKWEFVNAIKAGLLVEI